MTASSTAASRASRVLWFLLAYGVTLVTVASAYLLWIVVEYVPHHTTILEGLGAEIPFSTTLVITLAGWGVSVLPFLVVPGVPFAFAVLVIAFVVALKRGMTQEFLRECA